MGMAPITVVPIQSHFRSSSQHYFCGFISGPTDSTKLAFLCRWLGQNSKQNKLNRQLGDVQIRMRLKVSGDKNEIRQSYIPALFPHIIKPLMDVGAVCFMELVK
jgi:hypothetical protein